MSISLRFLTFLSVLVALLAAVVLVGGNGGLYSSEETLPPNLGVNLIAFVDMEGQVYVVSPDGFSSPRRISPEEGFFTWPVWSPDGTQLAFSGLTPDLDGPTPLTLFVRNLEDEDSRTIYTNEPGMGPILNGMPHYPIWSPDGTRLAFMASVPQGLTLFLETFADEQDARVILRNSPLYASWSADSRYMLVHGGVDHFLVEASTGESIPDFSSFAEGYRAPAWWPSDSSKVALMSQNRRGIHRLFVTDVESGDETLIDGDMANAAFLWSPDGSSLAVAESNVPGGILFQNISIFSPNGNKRSVEIEGNIIAYFWSPDSSKLAYVTLAQTRGVRRWMVVDVHNGERWPLVDFVPTQDQHTIFQFFDQFAHSHSPWSPDSDALVFTGRLHGAGVSASTSRQPAPQIFVVDTGPDPSVSSIADGLLAFWSPR